MSSTILVQSVLDDAAIRFGDPNKTHFDNTLLLSFYNDANEDITSRWKMLEIDAAFSWIAGEDRYSYPDDCVQMLNLQYNPTAVNSTTGPTDQNAWRTVKQIFEWSFIELTDGSQPTGDDKLYYLSRTNFLQVYPIPITAYYLAGLMSYWKLADRQLTASTRVDGQGQTYGATTIELPNAMRNLIRDRMIVGMKQSLSRTQEANNDLQIWEGRMDQVAPRIEDPVDDRREHVFSSFVTDIGNVV